VIADFFDLILRGAWVANADGVLTGSVGVRDGRIAAVWPDGAGDPGPADQVLDCTGKWVLPGGVDPHVHVGITFGAVATDETYEQCSAAALLGGTTTIVDFAIPGPGQTPLEAVDERLAAGRASLADFALHGCYTQRHAGSVGDIPALVERGVRTIKLYTTYRDELMASDELIGTVMTELARRDGLTYIHAEDNATIEELTAQVGGAGPIDYTMIKKLRPEAAEDRATARMIELARGAGAPVYFVHQSTDRAVDLAHAARAAGQPVFSEVCPHYLLLDESRYDLDWGECFTCCPPLRSPATRDALLAAVLAGAASTIGSDHCAFVREHKAAAAHDLSAMPFGVPGIQTRMPVLLSELHARRGLSMPDLVRLTATRPAQLSGLAGRKGRIAPGADADLLVWDPAGHTTITAAGLAQASDFSPFDGLELTGAITTVIRGGLIMVEDGVIKQRVPGRYQHAGPISF
jgi:dihydropyrimidinase